MIKIYKTECSQCSVHEKGKSPLRHTPGCGVRPVFPRPSAQEIVMFSVSMQVVFTFQDFYGIYF